MGIPDWLAPAVRRAWGSGYGLADLRADVLAGCVVGVIALPLSMALAIATGVPPQFGLYTAIVAGLVIAVLGGSPVQVSGPTAAFVVVLAPVVGEHGLAGLLVATMLAGGLLVLMGVARLGRLIEFVPYPVTTGFTAGIAVVIATLQMKDFLGLRVEGTAEHFVARVAALGRALPTAHGPDVVVGVVTLVCLLVTPRLRWTRRVPAALVALPVATLLAVGLHAGWSGFEVATIDSRFGGVPRTAPTLVWPWAQAGPGGGEFVLSLEVLRGLLPAAVAIALLGAIESLLSAVVAAGITGREHDPDGELVAQGVGNLVAPWFGGFAATGAIARTAANIRNGARSPVAAAVHAVFVLGAVVVAAPLLGYLPMAALAALLMLVAWNMSEARHVVHVLRVAPGSDKLVLVVCLTLTVVFDMTVAVSVGVVLAAVLFMKRMADVTDVRLVGSSGGATAVSGLPAQVLVYEVAGPLFFGAAQRAMSAIKRIDRRVSVVLLDLRQVPVMDATGLVNLESALERLHRANIYTIIAGVAEQPLHLMARAGWRHREWVTVYRSFEQGVEQARSLGHLVMPEAEAVGV